MPKDRGPTRGKRRDARSTRAGVGISTRTLVGGVAAVVVFVALVISLSLTLGGAEEEATTWSGFANAPMDGRVLGRADAPVTIVEYSDYK